MNNPTSSRMIAAAIPPINGLHRTAQRLLCALLLGWLSACSQPQTLVAGDRNSVDTAIFEQDLGSDKDSVLAAAGQRWQQQGDCALEKTGFGINRRAYFLERCEFVNPGQQTVCDMAPESVEYAFLDGNLVQVKYRFSEADADSHASCIQEQALANGFIPASEAQASDTEASQRVRLLSADAKTGISLGEAREVRVYDSALVPKIHMLRNDI